LNNSLPEPAVIDISDEYIKWLYYANAGMTFAAHAGSAKVKAV